MRLPKNSFAVVHPQTGDILQVVGISKWSPYTVATLVHCMRPECRRSYNKNLCWHEPAFHYYLQSTFKGESLQLIKALQRKSK